VEIDASIAAELDDLERAAGLQVAVVEEYQDGFYSMRVEPPMLMIAAFSAEGDPPLVIPEPQFVPCHIPRVRNRVVWRRYDEVT